jgi:alpha-aminoadipate carrier protein LysW
MPAECPVCGAALKIGNDMVVGELFDCKDCGCELEIKSLKPLEIAEAPTEEEDWGQ